MYHLLKPALKTSSQNAPGKRQPKPVIENLPGSKRSRTRARHVLRAAQVGTDCWVVNGGANQHTVWTAKPSGGYAYECDCAPNQNEKVTCSHILAVMLQIEPEKLP